MAQQIQEVFWLSSADREQLLHVSPAFEAIWGCSVDSLYTYSGGFVQLLVDSLHPEDKERVVAAMSQQHQHEYKAEYRIFRPDGSMRWVRSRSFPVQNQFGETWAIAGFSEDITERKHNEEILQQREQEFRALVENSPDLIFRLNREQRCVYVNPTVERERGKPQAAFIGKTIQQMDMPPAVISLWERANQTVFETGEENEVEFSYLTPNGLKHYQTRLAPEFAPDGSVESILGICRDITQKKQTEEALRESEERFRTVFQAAPIGIALTNPQGKLLKTNQAYQNIVGYTETELQNLPIKALTHPDDQAEDVKPLQELLSGQRTHICREKRYLRKDGSLIWVQLSATAVCDANGLPQYAIAMVQDITDAYRQATRRQQAELALQTAHAQLEQRVTERTAQLEQTNQLLLEEIVERKLLTQAFKTQQEFLQTIIDSNPNCIFVKNASGRYVLVNQAFAEFYGMSVEEVLGKTTTDLHLDPVDQQRFICQDQEVLTTLQQQFIPNQRCSTSSREVHWFQTIKKPLFSEDGQVCLILGVSTDITELKLAQEALQLSEARFRLAIDHIPDTFVIYDPQRRFEFVNAQGLKVSGKPLEEYLGNTDEEIWPDEVTKNYLPTLKRAVETRTIQTKECSITLPSNRTFTLLVGYVPVLDEQGEIYQVLGITHDITERKLSEEKLRQSEEQLHLAMDAARVGFWDWNLQTQVVTRSDNVKRMYGLAADTYEPTYRAFLSRLYPADCDRVHGAYQRAIDTGEGLDIEFRIVLPDGSIRWLESKSQVFYDEMGSPVRMAGINLDISDRKRAEAALQAQHEFLQTVLDNTPCPICVKDQDGKFQLANQALAALYGSTVADIIGKTDADFCTSQAEVEQFLRDDQDVITSRREKFILEERFSNKAGEVHWFQTIKKPLLSSNGQTSHVLAIATEITKRKQVEAALQESLREKEVLLQEIHHRVKNNLQVISSLLDLQSQQIQDQLTLEVFRTSQNRVKSMALVHEKLYQSKHYANINFSEYIESLTSYLLHVYGMDTRITLDLKVDDVVLNINTAIPCGLIINELVSNSLKYAFPNNAKGTITVALNHNYHENFTLIVGDDGIGLPQDIGFEKSESLGLQLVSILISQLEGTIEIDSHNGTQFKIIFSEMG